MGLIDASSQFLDGLLLPAELVLQCGILPSQLLELFCDRQAGRGVPFICESGNLGGASDENGCEASLNMAGGSIHDTGYGEIRSRLVDAPQPVLIPVAENSVNSED